MVGDVKVQRNKSPKWIDARPNMPLKENDAVRTFVESEAVVQFGDGSQISLKENTTLELSGLSRDAGGADKTGVKILSGDLMANVKKLVHKGSKFESEAPRWDSMSITIKPMLKYTRDGCMSCPKEPRKARS
jgi:hypothetical protein